MHTVTPHPGDPASNPEVMRLLRLAATRYREDTPPDQQSEYLFLTTAQRVYEGLL